jgi:ATP-dependent Lon protease
MGRRKNWDVLNNYNKEELNYFDKQSSRNKDTIINIEERLIKDDLNNYNIPMRFKFLLSKTTIENKKVMLNKLNELKMTSRCGGESAKLHKMITVLSQIPFGIYHEIKYDSISNYLNEVHKELNNRIYGHAETKNQIIRILAQFIVNPNAKGYVIGIQGSMGVGKTKLIKDGIAKVLKYPFSFIPLGGISDSSYLKGHLYTYEGSTYGKIVDEIIKAKVMNPIFFFDELDKISTGKYGDEIVNTLIHITDSTQNDSFTDKYLEEIKIDLSKSLMFFTFNDINMVNPILRDRMIIIKVDKYKLADKIELSKNFLIKEICKSYNIKDSDIIINDPEIEYIINKTTEEDGVRNLQRNINNIYSHINMHRFIKMKDDTIITFPFTITKAVIDKYLIMKREDCEDEGAAHRGSAASEGEGGGDGGGDGGGGGGGGGGRGGARGLADSQRAFAGARCGGACPRDGFSIASDCPSHSVRALSRLALDDL